MLLDDAKKIRAAKKLKEEQEAMALKPTVVSGIMITEKGAKEVNVSLGSDGLKIEPKVVPLINGEKYHSDAKPMIKGVKLTKKRKPRKTRAKKGK